MRTLENGHFLGKNDPILGSPSLAREEMRVGDPVGGGPHYRGLGLNPGNREPLFQEASLYGEGVLFNEGWSF